MPVCKIREGSFFRMVQTSTHQILSFWLMESLIYLVAIPLNKQTYIFEASSLNSRGWERAAPCADGNYSTIQYFGDEAWYYGFLMSPWYYARRECLYNSCICGRIHEVWNQRHHELDYSHCSIDGTCIGHRVDWCKDNHIDRSEHDYYRVEYCNWNSDAISPVHENQCMDNHSIDVYHYDKHSGRLLGAVLYHWRKPYPACRE